MLEYTGTNVLFRTLFILQIGSKINIHMSLKKMQNACL